MIPWIRISSYKEIIRSKWTWLLLGLCLVTLLAIVRWPKEAKKESIKTEEVERPKSECLAKTPVPHEARQEARLPQKQPLEELEEANPNIIKTVQGTVTLSDACTGLITVEGLDFDAAPAYLTGIRAGDVVKIEYTEEKSGWRIFNVVKSVRILASSQQMPRNEVPPQEEAWEEGAEGEELIEDESLEEVAELQKPIEDEPEEAETDTVKTLQGRVAGVDPCTGMITVGGMDFRPGTFDLAGIDRGDIVEITYKKDNGSKVLESIVVIETSY